MHAMIRRTKHLVLILAGAATLAAAAGPSIASAQDNGTATASSEQCAEWLQWFKQDLGYANAAVTAGRPDLVTKYYTDAAWDLKLATDGGCSWATVRVAPPPRFGRVAAPIGPVLSAH